jgi:hypothetical protein
MERRYFAGSHPAKYPFLGSTRPARPNDLLICNAVSRDSRQSRHTRKRIGRALGHHRGGQSAAVLLGTLVGRRGPLLAIILLLAALGAVYLLITDPLLDLYTGRQTILEQRRTLALHLAALAIELPRCAPVSPSCAQRRAS